MLQAPLENYKYKTHKEQLEKSFSSWLEKVNMNVLMSNFFGIETKDTNLITQEERTKFKIYLRHISKRVINAYLVKYKNEYFDNYMNEENENKNNKLNFQEIVKNFMSQAMMHDISHTVSISNNLKKENSIVPPFFNNHLHTSESVDLDLMKEELYAGIWQNTGLSKNPNSLFLLSKKLLEQNSSSVKILLDTAFSSEDNAEKEKVKKLIYKSFESEEDYINSYFEVMLLLVHNQNKHDLQIIAHSKFIKDEKSDWESYDFFMETESKKLLTNLDILRKEKDKKVLEMLTYIWGNKDNSRVLVDLFFKETLEYFKKLESRYTKK